MKKVKKFQLKIVIFTAMKNRCILHGCVFVMLYLLMKVNWSLDIVKHRLGYIETNI